MFAKVVRNFCNATRAYRDSKYFQKLTKIVRQHSSSSSFATSSFSDTSLKQKVSQLNSFARASRISRRSKSMISTEDAFIRFDLRSISSQASNYSSLINSSSRRTISDTFVDEIIHHESIESQSARNMSDFTQKQQRTIVIIVREAIQIISREQDDDDDDAESLDSFDLSKSSDLDDDNTDNNIK